MHKIILSTLLVFLQCFPCNAQDFSNAYTQYPNIPSGMLESLAWSRTRMHDMQGSDEHESCAGLPHVVGLFGLVEDGHNWFIPNFNTVALISGFSPESIKNNTPIEILAVAKTLSIYFNELPVDASRSVEESIQLVLIKFSELPGNNGVQQFSRDVQVYEVLNFMNNPKQMNAFNLPACHFDLERVFGANLALQTASRLIMHEDKIRTEKGFVYRPTSTQKSTEYGPAIWDPAPSCNYSSRGGIAISAIVIHTIQGSYSSAINWSQNCASSVSFHYVVRSSDGQITQMLTEITKGWHVGSENPYTIGYEHEGFVAETGWYTTAMYNASAALTRDIINSGYGINGLRTYYGIATVGVLTLGNCIKIKGHQHYPSQTHVDPGVYWDWERYYRLVNNVYTPTVITSAGTFYDNGGAAANYSDDLRQFWLFQPAGAQTVTLNFASFNTETGYDRMYIYDGNAITDPLIGTYMGTTSPGIVTSTGGSILVEFRSDCGTTAAGWNVTMSFTASQPIPVDNTAPLTAIQTANIWVTIPVDVNYADSDSSGIAQRLHLVADRPMATTEWKSNVAKRFMYETFESATDLWTNQTGVFTNTLSVKAQPDETVQNSNVWYAFPQTNVENYLYHWKQKIEGTSPSRRAGLHFYCSDATLDSRGDSYLVIYRDNTEIVELYKCIGNVLGSVIASAPASVPNAQWMDCKVFFSPITGLISVYLNDVKLFSYTDPAPFTTSAQVSLRSGGCAISYDDFQVYHSRGASATLEIGATGHFREQGPAVGIIKSIVIDNNKNLSTIAEQLVDVDWTAPINATVNDGTTTTTTDSDQTFSAIWSGNWSATDVHSNMAGYIYSIGTTSGAINITPWTNTTNPNFTLDLTSSNLVENQIYFINVKASNGAGLDTLFTSDGQVFKIDHASLSTSVLNSITVSPNPSSGYITLNFESNESVEFSLIDAAGRLLVKRSINNGETVDLSPYSAGTYTAILSLNGAFIRKLIVKK